METLKFKTNINCSGCVKAVTPQMNATPGVEKWQVATEDPEKILTVEASGAEAADIIQAVEKAGFKAEKLG
ncbi:MAG: copper chaperone [Sphingobacteriales bacterium]|nr:MAG: copper chaperone [Sphingobacteriales bacterium]